MRERFNQLTDMYQLMELADASPANQEELFQLLLEPNQAERLKITAEHFYYLPYSFPNQKEELFRFLMELLQQGSFKLTVVDIYELTARAFLHYKEEFYPMLMKLNHTEFFKLSNSEFFKLTQSIFRNHKEELFQLFMQLSQLEPYKVTVGDIHTLTYLLPNKKEELFQLITQLSHLERFEINSQHEINLLAQGFPEKQIFQKNSIDDILLELSRVYRLKSNEEKAYTIGATIGMFHKVLPPELAGHIGSYLDRKSGGMVSETCKSAALTALDERERQHEISPKF